MAVHGTATSAFDSVREEFEKNFDERGEVGASLTVFVDGEPVVDLWGGHADVERTRQWDEDTIGLVWSCTKGVVATAVHALVDRGDIDLDAAVTKYWPEFGKGGKEHITVAQLLSHQAGLEAINREVPAGTIWDRRWITAALAEQEPLIDPGTRSGYHAFTFGYLASEILERVTGASIGEYVRSEIAGPLGADLWLGLPEEHFDRVAPTIPAVVAEGAVVHPIYLAAATPGTVQHLMYANIGEYLLESDSLRAYSAELPSTGAVTNARGLASIYNALAVGGTVDGVRIGSPDSITRASTAVSASSADRFLTVPTRFGLGYWLAFDNRRFTDNDSDSFVIGRAAFGHVGFGGSFAFADPDARLAVAYTMNQQGGGAALNPRGQSLVDAVYRGLGYRTNAPGCWVP